MPKKQYRSLQLHNEMLKCDVDIVVGLETEDEMNRWLLKHKAVAPPSRGASSPQGRTVSVDWGKSVTMFIKEQYKPVMYGVLAHEAFHAASIILESRGQRNSDPDGEEIYGYFIEWIVREVGYHLEHGRGWKQRTI